MPHDALSGISGFYLAVNFYSSDLSEDEKSAAGATEDSLRAEATGLLEAGNFAVLNYADWQASYRRPYCI